MQKEAQEPTIEHLLQELSLTMMEIYPTIGDDIATLEACDESALALLSLVQELRMDLKFIQTNLYASFHALLTSTHSAEKRIHIQNLWADLLESYKLLYGFEKMRPRSIWVQIGAELQKRQVEGAEELYTLLFQTHETLTSFLVLLEPQEQEKKDRDLTYHYDDELLKVYDRVLRANDEDAIAKKLIDYLSFFRSLLIYADLIEQVEATSGFVLPEIQRRENPQLFLQRQFAEDLGQNADLMGALNMILAGADDVDKSAKVRRGIKRIKDFAEDNLPNLAFPEADNMDWLSNADLLLRYMLLENVAITKAYLNAVSEPAFPLLLRRLTITRVSTLVHLYGYNENERKKALWTRIIELVPSSSNSLALELDALNEALKGLIIDSDKSDRALYVHLIDNSTYNSNVPAIVAKMEAMNPYIEFQKMNDLIRVATRVRQFLSSLLDVLAAEANEDAVMKNMKMKAQIETFRGYARDSKIPDTYRNRFLAQLEEIETMLSRFNR